MPIAAQQPQGKIYPQAPKGAYQAVLSGIKDMGMQPAFDVTKPDVPKLAFIFELNAEDENGERYEISKWVTNSKFFSVANGKMSGMVEMLTQWLDLTAGEIGTAIFDDLEILSGLNARVRVVQKPKQDGTMKSHIDSFEPWDEKMGPIIDPGNPAPDGTVYRGKSLADLLAETKGVAGLPAASAPSKPAPNPAAPRESRDDPRATNGGASSGDYAKKLARGEEPPRVSRPAPVATVEAEADSDERDVFEDE